ncbi:tight adherence pilus pseudopilin TadF [Yersinia enterocolitica]|uniref:tight adherence pilus pseudopilin TadF n=1 Tax=Yersinia enterocolitica TaxID=630 RepID=UPI001C8D71CB|nr:tight adherence pilus pseudopilin TadF [Yersinia enterocolitica]MBX9497879.1 pseudopilin [Yersinia enterocolitica]HDL7750783.1 pseudopilin [Yersinia enterocolitica]HDL7825233.1 pseudopilin [Yersinia enterocolitica]HDL7832495.1 pseudopilin [Yersinia enterocolitica]HDL7874199.1 pseudopilin [Yersinia enterocolitica]
MFKNINNKFIINSNGAIIIELVFVVTIIALFIKLLLSVAAYKSTVGKLDRISYSIAGIIRERVRLYDGNNILTQKEVIKLKQLSVQMLLNSGTHYNNITMRIETLHFNDTDSPDPEHKIIDDTKSVSFNVGACEPARELREMSELSPYGNTGRWIPLYQVTLCLPTIPWYSNLFSPDVPVPAIKSSAITIER